jgi:hypothetical protein
MTRSEIIATLRTENPRARADLLAIYADAYVEYLRCQKEIAEKGAVVAGKESPYCAPRDRASKTMRDIRIKADTLWER